MHLERIIYRSRIADAINIDETFDNIFSVSVRNNHKRGLTGALAFEGEQFIQVLEGSSNALDDLLSSLMSDKRHRNVSVLERRKVRARSFGNWAMADVRYAGMTRSESLILAESSSADQVALLLLRLASAVSSVAPDE